MKRKYCFLILSLITLLVMTISYMPVVKAADEYNFELEYTGDIVVNETKDGKVILKGTDGTAYAKVRIKVDIEGPATPKVLATDSAGVEHDIAQLGYWGPDAGFAVGGTFENITPIKATFTAAGTYTIKLSLINLEAGDAVIVTKEETIEVLEDKSNIEDTGNTEKEEIKNEEIEKLPQTGTSIMEYIIYAGILLTVIGYGYYKIKK